jgi:uncharacterized tellurite resistance protein B-like protein
MSTLLLLLVVVLLVVAVIAVSSKLQPVPRSTLPGYQAPSTSPPPRPTGATGGWDRGRLPARSDPARSVADPEGFWTSAGHSATVRGFTMPGGMFYLGRGLSAVSQWVGAIEPALIDPALNISARDIDRAGQFMGYWPSYSAMQPASRAAYLEWLAAGRATPGAHIGYVFLFFYGLERRVLHDAQRSEKAKDEVEGIIAEVERLSLYGDNRSFQGYAGEFLQVARLLHRSVSLESLKPAMERQGWELPIASRLALGMIAGEGRPLPPEWALSWLVTAPEVTLRTPAVRCREEFRELFLLRYREKWGEGLKFKPIKTRLSLQYRPASSSFGGVVTLSAPDLPDATRNTATLERLKRLADEVCQDLDAFSRRVGRTGEVDSPAAVGLLPSRLAKQRGGPRAEELTSWLQHQLGAGDLVLIRAQDLLQQWSGAGQEAGARRDLQLLSGFLVSRGFGIEPDVRVGGPSLAKTEHAALFRLTADDEPGPSYHGVALLLHLGAMLAAADGEISPSEVKLLEDRIHNTTQLTAGERARLTAHLSWLLADPPSLAGVKRKVEPLDEAERTALGAFLISLAGADGRLTSDEMKLLTRAYDLMGLDAKSIYSEVHHLMSAESPPAVEPVTVLPGKGLGDGFQIPSAHDAGSAPSAIHLDQARVRAKLAETERVADILSGIFADEETPTKLVSQLAQAPQDDFAIAGLDSEHSALLLKLAEQPSWERVRVERLAAALGLLPDGALEVINEAAFARCGATLLEGDENIEIEKEVLREMLQ